MYTCINNFILEFVKIYDINYKNYFKIFCLSSNIFLFLMNVCSKIIYLKIVFFSDEISSVLLYDVTNYVSWCPRNNNSESQQPFVFKWC